MTPTPDLAIRMARAGFNRALAECDLPAIAAVLAPEVILVAGTDSAVISGRKTQLTAWKREFALADRSIYVRMPDTIIVSSAYPLAFEHGEWKATAANGGAVTASGTYTAKWRQFGSDWMIEAELFLTLA